MPLQPETPETSPQTLPSVERPPYWGVDLEPLSRPGVQTARQEPRPFPNTRYPPERQQGEPSSPVHGNSKPVPPVFGTSVPLRGLSGAIRRAAYRIPDHYPRHWLLKLLGDRVDSLEHRIKRAAPGAALLMAVAGAAALVRRSR